MTLKLKEIFYFASFNFKSRISKSTDKPTIVYSLYACIVYIYYAIEWYYKQHWIGNCSNILKLFFWGHPVVLSGLIHSDIKLKTNR